MAQLPVRPLGKTGLSVTRLGFGSSVLRGTGSSVSPELTPAVAERVLHGVLDAGINYIDTHPVYGVAEEMIGRFLHHRRDEFYLATKVGTAVSTLPVLEPRESEGYQAEWTVDNIRASIEWSLRMAKTDHFDVVQLASPPPPTELAALGVVETLEALHREGKILHLGFTGEHLHFEADIAGEIYEVAQFPYSGFHPDFAPMIERAAALGIGTVVRGGGTARNRRTRVDPSPRSEIEVARAARAGDWARFEDLRLDELLDGDSRSGFLLRYVLSHPHVDTTIVGTVNLEHLADNVAATARGPLAPELYAEASRRFAAIA